MRISIGYKIVSVALVFLIHSCALVQQTKKTEKEIKKEIIKGVTTETMALNLLGMPNSVSPNGIGDEVWNYNNLRYSTTESKDGKTLVLWELTTGDSTEVPRPFQLLITFDQTDIVKNFEIVNISVQNF